MSYLVGDSAFLDVLAITMIAVAFVWCVFRFALARHRRRMNLTMAASARPNRAARPDFLESGAVARKRAAARADDYARSLEDGEGRPDAVPATVSRGERTMRWISLGMACFTLATMVSGTIFQVSYISRLVENYGAVDRMLHVVTNYPLATAVAVIVIAYNTMTFVREKRWLGKTGAQR